MPAKKTMAQRLGQALETMTRQCGQLPETPAYGSWLLGRVSESPSRRWVRIKRIVTVYIMTANLTGIVVALLVVTFAFPVPSIYTDAPWWVTFGVAPAYATLALAIGTYWITTRIVRASIRWAIEERAPSQADGRNTLLLPFRVAAVHLILWDIGGALLATLYGLANRVFVTIILFSVTICGVLVATNCYLFTEFALRPVAAKALEAGRPPRRFAPGIMGRTMTVWSLGSGVPVTGIATTALYVLLVHNLTETQLASAVLILSITTLIFGFLVMWILAWLTAAPVRVVRAALKRVEQGEPPRHVRRLQFLERMGSCQVVHRGGTRRSCVSGRCGWSQRSAVSTIRSGQRSVRSPVYLVLAARRRCVSGCARRRSMPAHGPGPRPKNPLS